MDGNGARVCRDVERELRKIVPELARPSGRDKTKDAQKQLRRLYLNLRIIDSFYNKSAGWLDPLAKFYDHQALNYEAVLACAFASSDGICINDNLAVPTDAETLVSLKPDASTLCWFWPAPGTRSLPV